MLIPWFFEIIILMMIIILIRMIIAYHVPDSWTGKDFMIWLNMVSQDIAYLVIQLITTRISE